MAFERLQGTKEKVLYALFIVAPAIILSSAFSEMTPPGSSRLLFGIAGGGVGSLIGYYSFNKTKKSPMKIRVITIIIIWVLSVAVLLIANQIKPIID